MSAHVSRIGGDHATRARQAIKQTVPIRTLVVDDTPDVLEVICALLSMEEGVELIGRAKDGSEALEAVCRLRPDLVVMDVQMPVMDGLTAAALIRSKFPEVSVVLMSACPASVIDDQVRASGAGAFIDKLHFGEIFPRVLSRVASASQTRM